MSERITRLPLDDWTVDTPVHVYRIWTREPEMGAEWQWIIAGADDLEATRKVREARKLGLEAVLDESDQVAWDQTGRR